MRKRNFSVNQNAGQECISFRYLYTQRQHKRQSADENSMKSQARSNGIKNINISFAIKHYAIVCDILITTDLIFSRNVNVMESIRDKTFINQVTAQLRVHASIHNQRTVKFNDITIPSLFDYVKSSSKITHQLYDGENIFFVCNFGNKSDQVCSSLIFRI